jgi:hypothetical protein
VVATVAAGGSLILLTTVLFKDEIHDWLFAIRRVRTWGDLLAQKPIRLSDGVVVRLGIEDTRCPQGSGVLLYCLTEGYDPGLRGLESEGELGPLNVSIAMEGGIQEPAASVVFAPEDSVTAAAVLFIRSIRIPRSGSYCIKVSERGAGLRGVTVIGTDDPFQPWLTLEETSPKPIDEFMEVEDAYIGTFVPCAGSAAIPSWVGYIPYNQTGSSSIDPTVPLPRLLPDFGARPEIDLKVEANWLIVTSANPICSDRLNFAARWWINGAPRQVPRTGTGFHNAGGREYEVEQLRFELDFDACAPELRSGDRLSLQLMYSDQSWSLTDGREGYFSFSEQHRVLQSNRIELTVP